MPTFTKFDTQMEYLAELAMEIDTSFRIFQEAQVYVSFVADQFVCEETFAAKPSSKFPNYEKDTKDTFIARITNLGQWHGGISSYF